MATTDFFRPHAVLCIAMMFLSFTAFAVAPEVTTASGSMKEGQIVTLKGNNFTAKANAKPLLFWSAEGGTNPSALGRKVTWDSTFNGQIVDQSVSGAIIAPGSNKALRHDYGESEGAILARVSFESDQMYMWRKRYDDFDILKDFGIRLRYTGLTALSSASTVDVGMLMATADKTVWGKVVKSEQGSGGVGTTYFSNKVGTVMNKALARAVARDSVVYFYDTNDTLFTKPLFKALCNEGEGVYHSFNHKIFRIWGKYGGGGNNSFFTGLNKDGGGVTISQTEASPFYIHQWDHVIEAPTDRWAVEELQYQASSDIEKSDGIAWFFQDRTQAWLTRTFKFRTATYPLKYSDLYQSQTSNGAQPLSFEYFDALYVDESWHRVMVCSESTWSKCKQPEVVIPTAWADNEIKVSLRLGSLKNTTNFYFYVVNGLGEVNEKGYASCPLCPMPPAQR